MLRACGRGDCSAIGIYIFCFKIIISLHIKNLGKLIKNKSRPEKGVLMVSCRVSLLIYGMKKKGGKEIDLFTKSHK